MGTRAGRTDEDGMAGDTRRRTIMREDDRAGHQASAAGGSLLLLVGILLLLLGLTACGDATPTEGDGLPIYVLDVSGEEFRVLVTDPAETARLDARMASGVVGVVSGELLPGPGGFNGPWSWHLDPTTVHVPDQSIELCDGRPSMVEDDLGYWLDTVGRFCPWGARVVRVER